MKLGIVGGVGPAATVDFMAKIIRNTRAEQDQDHLKIVVEQNPQIPDRTAHLVGTGPDPTIALYATCRKLQDAQSDLIAIPCNTAHAFVTQIQGRLRVPIVNMLEATAAHACSLLPEGAGIGLLATNGTVKSRLYHDAFAATGLQLLTPDATHQQLVTEAIYGSDGIKAGHVDDACREKLHIVLRHLAGNGAAAVILGCTELPLVLHTPDIHAGERRIVLLDPTEILAKKCIEILTTTHPQ
jgi:aspartate racemase